jgi:acyl-CoA synthetase (AMP-forming)/AMP-acid ligase II
VVAFHNLASGTSTALPPIDLRRPAELDPAKVVDYLRRHRVTSLSGAPAFMEGLCDHLIDRGDVLEDIARVLVGGGPVSAALSRKVLASFPNARDEAWGVYGSTEAEPIAHVAMTHMIASENAREGFLVGHPVEEAEVRLLTPTKGVIRTATMEELEALAITTPGEVGEIVVAGAHVVPRYLDDPRADALNKLYPSQSEVWHRTGDTGQWDENRELWLTGRVADLVWHRGQMLEPFTLEQQLDGWPGIERCALVSLDASDETRLFLAVVPTDWERWEALEDRLLGWLGERSLDAILPLRLPQMPVDKRHQTKLDRPTLRRFLMLYRHLLPPLP